MGTRTTLAVICALLTAPALSADTLTVISDRDNTLYEVQCQPDGKVCERSNGAGFHFFAGRTQGKDGQGFGELRRGLIHFDVSSIPPGSTIDSVVLTLNMSRTIAGPQDVSLHSALADWGEGTSDAPGQEGGGADATPGDATWFHTFFDTSFWATVGGDFAATPSATTVVGSEGVYTWGSTPGMEADVSAWVDNPSMNFGWVVVGEENLEGGGATTKRFDTREIDPDEGPFLMPELSIDFTLPVPVELQSFDID